MPTASQSIEVLRPDLGEFTEFNVAGNDGAFIADLVLPPINVALQASQFGRIPREALLQNPETSRGSHGGYNRIDWEFEKDSYATKEYGLESRIDQRNAKIYGNFIRSEIVTAQINAHNLRLAREKRVSAQIFNATTWTGATLTTAAAVAWHTAATAAPITDVNAAKLKVWALTGKYPNALIINRKSLMDLKLCDQVLDAIRSAGAGSSTKQADISLEMLAQVFDLSKVIVAGGTSNSAGKGQTFAAAPVWGSHTNSSGTAMVACIAESDNIEEPCLGRTFHWTEDGSQLGGAVETYYDPTRRGDIVRNRFDVDEKVFDPSFAHRISGV